MDWAVPEPIKHQMDRIGTITSGGSMVKRGGDRFHWHGVVGANTPGAVGGLVDGFLYLILDLAHVLLVLGGMYLVVQAIRS